MSANIPGVGGFEPKTSPAERRDFFDIRKRFSKAMGIIDQRLITIETALSTLTTTYTAEWTYKSNAGAPPGNGVISGEGGPPATTVNLSLEDADGGYRPELGNVAVDDVIAIRGSNADTWVAYTVTSISGELPGGVGYHSFGVTVRNQGSGTPKNNTRTTVDLIVKAIT